MSAPPGVAVPDWFVDEVADAGAELADIAPQILTLIGQVTDRYRRIETTFNEIVPRTDRLETDAVWQVPWAESGALQLQDRVDELVAQIAARCQVAERVTGT